MMATFDSAKAQLLFGFFVASIVMLALTYQGQMNEGYFTLYLGAIGTVYGYAKRQDTIVKEAEIKKDTAIAQASQ